MFIVAIHKHNFLYIVTLHLVPLLSSLIHVHILQIFYIYPIMLSTRENNLTSLFLITMSLLVSHLILLARNFSTLLNISYEVVILVQFMILGKSFQCFLFIFDISRSIILFFISRCLLSHQGSFCFYITESFFSKNNC